MRHAIVALLEHHQDRALSGHDYNALRNCHTRGLDSIVLHDEPGNRVRLFIAGWAHNLWTNRNGHQYSVGIHSHHCNVRLVRLYGQVYNQLHGIVPAAHGDFREYRYQSAITHGEGKVEPTGRRAFMELVNHSKAPFDAVSLQAYQLHTIFVPVNTDAAWLVIEGEEDPAYEPLFWSNADQISFDGLYEPMAREQVAKLLGTVVDKVEQ